jgi:hypothetical protein
MEPVEPLQLARLTTSALGVARSLWMFKRHGNMQKRLSLRVGANVTEHSGIGQLKNQIPWFALCVASKQSTL